MRLYLLPVVSVLSLCCLLPVSRAFAQNLGPTSSTLFSYDDGRPRVRRVPTNDPAKAAYDAGMKASLRHDYTVAADFFATAIQADPSFEESHRSYIRMVRESQKHDNPKAGDNDAAADKKLIVTYDRWIQQHPDQAGYYWGKANILPFASDESDALLRKAIEVDPKYIPAYDLLQSSYLQRGKVRERQDLLEKVAELKPDNQLAALELVTSYRHSSPVQMVSGTSLDLFDVMLRHRLYEVFPDKVVVIRGLAMQAADAPTVDARRKYLEKAASYVSKFPNDGQLTALMGTLFRLYSDNDPARALTFAHEMVEAYPSEKNWPELERFQQLANDGNAALDAGDGATAVSKLTAATAMTEPLKLDVTRPWLLLARAYGVNHEPDRAYTMLLEHTAKFPHHELVAALRNEGALRGMPADAVRTALLAKMAAGAEPFSKDTFTDFKTGKPVSIRDYAGHVVFVTFWFPSCGHCKEEYPYFNQTLARYRNRGFAVLAPNVVKEEDNVAIANMRAYDFTLLKVPDPEWEVRTYKTTSAPVNFLIDQQGRVLASPRVDSTEDQALLEDEIELLLGGASSGGGKAAQ